MSHSKLARVIRRSRHLLAQSQVFSNELRYSSVLHKSQKQSENERGYVSFAREYESLHLLSQLLGLGANKANLAVLVGLQLQQISVLNLGLFFKLISFTEQHVNIVLSLLYICERLVDNLLGSHQLLVQASVRKAFLLR